MNEAKPTATTPWGEFEIDAMEEAVRQSQPKEGREAVYLKAVLATLYAKDPMMLLLATIGPSAGFDDISPSEILQWWEKNKPYDMELIALRKKLQKVGK